MEGILRQILEMSMYGSIAIVCVLILRLLFRKTPKKVSILLWIIVAVRLLCPLNIGSRFGIMNLFENHADTVIVSSETAETASPEEVIYAENPGNEEKISAEDTKILYSAPSEAETSGIKAGRKLPGPYAILLMIWITGEVIFCTTLVVSAAKLKIRLCHATPDEDGAYGTDGIRSAFVSGILRPRIYMPAVTGEDDRRYILLHEKTHIRYHDQITKMICLAALGIHWFNPLVWAAYILFSRDLEMRVDETVIEILGEDHRKEYCRTLVSNAQMPLMYKVTGTAFAGRSFGGTEVKMRIKNLIIRKKTSLMTTAGVLAALLGITLASSACAPQDESVTVPSEDNAATVTSEETEVIEEADERLEAMRFLRFEELDPGNGNISDYGTTGNTTWDELADSACISADDIQDENLRVIAIEMEENGLQIYDLDKINQGLGGISFNEGIVVYTDNSVQIFFNADLDNVTTICSNLDAGAHLVLTSTSDNYFTGTEIASELQKQYFGDTPVNVCVERQDVETDEGTVEIYHYTIETGSELDTGDMYLISYDPESGTASFQAVIGK